MDFTKATEFNLSKEVLSLLEGKKSREKLELILKNHLPHSQDISKVSLLHYFAENGDKKMVQYLIKKHYNVNSQDLAGDTPVMVAVRKHHTPVVKLLVTAGADMMMINNENRSALQLICEDFTPEIGKLVFDKLCKKFSSLEETARSFIDAGCHLYQACCFGSSKMIEYMLEHGFSVESQYAPLKLSALHLAVQYEYVDCVKVLLKYGADINVADIRGSTPLCYIYHSKPKHTPEKIELLKILLSQKASLTSCVSNGIFQISPTLMRGNHEAIRLVLQSDVDCTARDPDGRDILHYLAVNRNPNVIQELKLFINKYDVKQVDNLGMSVLHVATTHNNIEMINILLDQGIDPNCAANNGFTPLFTAYSEFELGDEHKFQQNVELLLQNNADPQCIVTKKNSKITLFDAAKKNNNLKRLRPVIAHLALLEGLGVPITEMTSTKINFYPLLKKYFDRYQKLIRKRISGRLTLFQLLTDKKRKIAQYSGNEKLMRKLTRLKYKQNLKFAHFYFYNILEKQFSEGIQYRILYNKASEIVCKVLESTLQSRFDKKNLVISKIISYLDENSLKQLLKVKGD